MEATLDKIDIIRERTGLSYAEAKEALDKAGGDVVEALLFLEKGENTHDGKSAGRVFSGEMIRPIKKAFRKSSRMRIRVSNQDGTLLEIPITLGLVGALFAPRATALSAMALIIAQYNLESCTTGGQEPVWEH